MMMMNRSIHLSMCYCTVLLTLIRWPFSRNSCFMHTNLTREYLGEGGGVIQYHVPLDIIIHHYYTLSLTCTPLMP